jgi:hypothetical protein
LSQIDCSISKYCAVVKDVKVPVSLISSLMLLLFIQFHPFFENPPAHVSQLSGESIHVAHEEAHLVHFDERPEPDKIYPGLH